MAPVGRRKPIEHLSGMPVHDGNQIWEASARRDVGVVDAPDLLGSFHALFIQQIGIGLMRLASYSDLPVL